jgi:hypothetical protein
MLQLPSRMSFSVFHRTKDFWASSVSSRDFSNKLHLKNTNFLYINKKKEKEKDLLFILSYRLIYLQNIIKKTKRKAFFYNLYFFLSLIFIP